MHAHYGVFLFFPAGLPFSQACNHMLQNQLSNQVRCEPLVSKNADQDRAALKRNKAAWQADFLQILIEIIAERQALKAAW